MRFRHLASSAALLVSIAAVASPARANGVLFSGAAAINPSHTDIDVTIDDAVATTVTELRFPCCATGATRLSTKVPAGASVVGFDVFRNGAWESASLTSADATKPSDPGPGQTSGSGALEAYLGEDGFTIDLPPFGNDVIRVRITTLGLAPYDLGKTSYVLPIEPAPIGATGNGDVTAQVTVRSGRAFTGWSGDLPGETVVQNGLEGWQSVLVLRYASPTLPPAPFHFTYGVDASAGLYAHLLTDHRRCEEAGFFLLVIEPSSDVAEGAVQPKAFSFVMDRSGSMQGPKMTQTKSAAHIGVGLLGSNDTFNVLAFSSDVTSAFPALTPVTDDAKNKANSFIDQQLADGGTNIADSLGQALSANVEEGRARVVVFLTDGQPTVGLADPSAIVQSVKAKNASGSRIFSFGVGADVNKLLLKNLATSSGGEARFLDANADLAAELGAFFQSVSRPVLVDATTTFGGLATHDVLPEGAQDLFAGRQMLVVGRYDAGGTATGALTGTLSGAQQSYDVALDFPACALNAAPFLPKLWAKSKIDALLAKMAESGHDDPAIIAEVEQLSKEYGVQSPYASYGVPAQGSGSGSGTTGGSPGGSQSGNPTNYSSGALDDEPASGCAVASGTRGADSGALTALFGALAVAGARLRRRRASAPR